MSIADGRSTGNKHFFFLPPIQPNPSTNGVANPNLSPQVQICQVALNSSPNSCGTPLAVFTTTSGPGGATVKTDAAQHYGLNWQTDQFDLDPSLNYRIRVLVGSIELGFADVNVVLNAKAAKNNNTGDFITLVDGRTLPIKFTIDHGALCKHPNDCFEGKVTPAGGDFITNSGFAAAHFEPGTISQETNLIIDRVTLADGPCHPTAGEPPYGDQFEGCYFYRTEPFAGPFAEGKPVRVEICLTLMNTDPQFSHTELFQTGPDETTRKLPSAPNSLIRCGSFTGSGDGGLGSLQPKAMLRYASHRLRALGRSLANLLLPRPANATTVMTDLGLGGTTGSFSNIGWAIVID